MSERPAYSGLGNNSNNNGASNQAAQPQPSAPMSAGTLGTSPLLKSMHHSTASLTSSTSPPMASPPSPGPPPPLPGMQPLPASPTDLPSAFASPHLPFLLHPGPPAPPSVKSGNDVLLSPIGGVPSAPAGSFLFNAAVQHHLPALQLWPTLHLPEAAKLPGTVITITIKQSLMPRFEFLRICFSVTASTYLLTLSINVRTYCSGRTSFREPRRFLTPRQT